METNKLLKLIHTCIGLQLYRYATVLPQSHMHITMNGRMNERKLSDFLPRVYMIHIAICLLNHYAVVVEMLRTESKQQNTCTYSKSLSHLSFALKYVSVSASLSR